MFDFTPMEAIIASTAGVAKLFMQDQELGKVQPGYYADMILVDGDPLKDITIFQDHTKLNVITINGRIHKASPKDFDLARNIQPKEPAWQPKSNPSNYVSYLDGQQRPRVGHLDLNNSMVTPLTMLSGAPVSSLYQVIELENAVVPSGNPVPLAGLTVLAPLNDRDILAVGKNYMDHAVEFNRSGYDSSDKVDQRECICLYFWCRGEGG